MKINPEQIHSIIQRPNTENRNVLTDTKGKSMSAPNLADSVEISNKSKVLLDIGKEIMSGYDLRNASPKNMNQLSSELYSSGLIPFETHSLISFQPELNSDQYYNLHGELPLPDRPRDFITDWEEKLAFQEKTLANPEFTKKTRQILSLLTNLDSLSKT